MVFVDLFQHSLPQILQEKKKYQVPVWRIFQKIYLTEVECSFFFFFFKRKEKETSLSFKITGIFITFAKGKISANNWNWLVIKFPNKNSNAKLNRMNSVQSAPWYNVIISYASDKHGSYQSNQGNEELKKKKGNNHFKNLKMKLNWFLE